MPVASDQEIVAYEVGVRISQCQILSNPEGWTIMPSTLTLTAALGSLTVALDRLRQVFGVQEQMLHQCMQLQASAVDIVNEIPDDIDAWCFDGFHAIFCKLITANQLFVQFFESRSTPRNKMIHWYRLGIEIPRGFFDNPSDMPPGCTNRRPGNTRWMPDDPALLDSLLGILNLSLCNVFPDVAIAVSQIESIPDLPAEVCHWDCVEAGLRAIRESDARRANRTWDDEMESRNRYIYERCCDGVPHCSIQVEVNRIFPNSDSLESTNAVREAAIRYARMHHLAPPPARQRGRRRKSN